MSKILDNASELCAHLNEHVLYDDEIDELNLLDALATCGLALVEDDSAETSLAYQDLLRPPPTA